MATGKRERMDSDRVDRNRMNKDREGVRRDSSIRKAGSLGQAGSPGRTPGNAEGDRSDIEEWLKKDGDQERREERDREK